MDKLEIYRRADGLWAWRRVSANGDVIATDGGQGYVNEDDCLRGYELSARPPERTFVYPDGDPRVSR